MAAVKRVREKLLEAGDWQKYPKWFKKVMARRLLLMLIPSELSRSLPRWLSAPIFGDNATYPDVIAWPDWMIIPPDFEWPDWWTPWMMMDFGPGVTPENAFPPGWAAGDPLPAGVSITAGYPFPPNWTTGDPLPAGVTLEPGASFPPGWAAGDLMPPGVTLVPTYTLPPDWTPNVPIPPDVDITKPETWPPDFTPQKIPPKWILISPWIYIPEPETPIAPTLPDIFDPKPKPVTKKPGKLPSTTIHLPITDWRSFTVNAIQSWADARTRTNALSRFKVSQYGNLCYVYRRESTNRSRLGRTVHKIAIPEIPYGARYEAGIIIFYRCDLQTCNVVLQASTIDDIDDYANYSKFTGDPTQPCDWTEVKPIIELGPDIISYINDNKGGDIYLIAREYDHDYLGPSPPDLDWIEALYYAPDEPGKEPDVVLRYRG